jgi:hypothetical protein
VIIPVRNSYPKPPCFELLTHDTVPNNVSFFSDRSRLPIRVRRWTNTNAQSLPSGEEAVSLLQRAFDETKMREEGTPPYHLVARVHLEMEGTFRDGMYEVLWAAPDRFRENFKIETLAETDLGFSDKLYVFRTSPLVMFPFFAVRQLLSSPIPTRLIAHPEAKRIAFDEIQGKRRTCIYIHQDAYVSESVERVCFNTATNEVVLIEIIPGGSSDSYRLQLEDFVGIGAKRYPTHLYEKKFGQILDVKIEAIDAAKFSDSVLFRHRVWNPVTGAHIRFCGRLRNRCIFEFRKPAICMRTIFSSAPMAAPRMLMCSGNRTPSLSTNSICGFNKRNSPF